MTDKSNSNLEKRLRKQAKARAAFKIHLLVFIAVMVFLWALNVIVMWDVTPKNWYHWWALWPTLGWGLGVFLHGISTYAGTGMVEREYQKLKRKHGP